MKNKNKKKVWISDYTVEELFEMRLKQFGDEPSLLHSPNHAIAEEYQTLKYLTNTNWKRWVLEKVFDFDWKFAMKSLKQKYKEDLLFECRESLGLLPASSGAS